MAFVALIPQTLNVILTQTLGQEFQTAKVTAMDGATAIDLSAWVSLTAKCVPLSPGPNTTDVTFGTVTASNQGIVTLVTSASDLAAVTPGTGKLIISGKPTAGDGAQILASGTLTLNQG